MKRQNSWQDGIARIFKSYDSEKNSGDSSTTLDSQSMFSSEKRDDPCGHNDLDMSKVFQGCEEEEGAGRNSGDTQANVPDNEAGSLSDLPDRQPPLAPAKAPGPSSPALPSDSFLKRLGSLFHFFSKAEPRVPQPEPDPAPVSEPGGVACPADRSQQASETSSGQAKGHSVGLQCPEMDKAPPEQDQDQSSAHVAAQTATECEPTGQTTERLPSVEKDHETAWSQAADKLTLTEDADKAQEQEQVFEGPAVITHSTYRGQREVRKMRRKQPLQIYSPISEGDESYAIRGRVSSEGVVSPVLLSNELPQHRDSAVELRDETSEQSDALPFQDVQPSSQASQGHPTDGQQVACKHTLEDALNVHQGCQESPCHSVLVPDIGNCQVKDCFLYTNKSLDVQLPNLPVGQDCNQGTGESVGKPRLPVDEERLQCESKAMVDLILKNALTALQKMETVEQENDIPHVSDIECEGFTYAGVRHAYQKEEFDFQDATQELEDKHVLATHADDQVISRAHGDNSRSTFSSGYESIAGSDTDIRSSPGQSFEGSPLALPASSLHIGSPCMATPGIPDSYQQAPGDSESDFTDCEKYDHESGDGITNTPFEIEDRETKEVKALTPEREDLYSNSCLANVPEVEDKEIRPKASQNSEQSVDFQTVSHCTNQIGTIYAENNCQVIERTEVARVDLESFSLSEEKLQSQEVVRPKPLHIAQQSGESHEFQGKAVMEPTCWSSSEPRPESETGKEHEGVLSEDHCVRTALCAGAIASDDEERTEDGLNADDRTMDVDLLASAIRVLVSAPQSAQSSSFPICDNEEEEEEIDAIFVNDTGTMERAAVRRGKTYPFSLSPIFEEEESLQVPPATEELKTAEQQTCSILSLLQSVSERLQSSAFTDDDPDDPETCTDSMDAFRCSRWGSLSDREDADDENYLSDPDPPPDSLTSLKNEQEGPTAVEETVGAAPQEVHEEKDWVTALSKPKRIARSPYYDCLKSKPSPIPQEGCISEGKPSKTLVKGERLSLKRIIPRPSVMHIYDGVTFSGEKQVVYGDVVDTGGRTFKTGVSIRVLTGCWLLYVEPGFKGSCVVLEEGERVLTSAGEELKGQGTDSPCQLSIGSIKRVVKDDSIPEIHCHREGEAPIVLHSQVENLETVQTSSLTVKSGCWLAYEQSGFNGNFAVLEIGGKTAYGSGPMLTHVRSLRPLKRGGPKVSRPLDPKLVLYELPDFQGRCRELEANAARVEGLPRVSSLRVISGIWVGYSRENYRGQQCLLEEGEYRDCRELGGADHLFISFRFLLADCIEPAMSLRNAHSPETAHMDIVDLDVLDVERDGPNLAPASIWVKSGVWVAYSGKFFSGEQYVLEKGQHSAPLDWGDCSREVMSIRPVRLSSGSRHPKYLIRVYSGPQFSGERGEFESEAADCSALHPVSFRVIHGSWVLFSEEGYSGNQFVLTEGLYPDLSSCGSGASVIKSLKPVPYCFSEPSITLFSLDSFEGLQTEAVTTMDSMNGFFTQSLRVNSGLWVAYEYSHFQGRQRLLQTGEYSLWGEHSGWDTLGSLQALGRPKAYVQLRNRLLGSLLTAEPALNNDSPARLCVKAPQAFDCQKWIFSDGLLKCKVGKACMSVIGGKAHVGARVALWPEHGRTHQRWSLNANGTLSSHLNHSLVLDIRGGNGIDRDHFIVNEFSADQSTQLWDIELV